MVASSIKAGTLAFQGRGGSNSMDCTLEDIFKILPKLYFHAGKIKLVFT